ncbi:lysozyme inhibitor LprI family protein [Rhizobiaceae bacterium n13]|uniref:Lysozyme inhibitor LprI family protein n=1 Tax=Ferirhizobium litorale TaxID=2927786 RepID=A0AAE3U011_9HYPH|nr:lysozyme inhibitor LprI family protein [Fererhizobium litorale]MDI7860668.1 lysozyme inhibitor LprI family protein [Fererhizobium litorale]MDI7920816.1 lysozyme inhibitor LprI family protein [Fererhizobium litorale]
MRARHPRQAGRNPKKGPRTRISAASVLALALFSGIPVFAQEDPPPNCTDPQTQTDMNICANLDFQNADKALNEQYRKTREIMRSWDSDLSESAKGAEKALLKAQRAWIDYRDGHCQAVGFQVSGGSIAPLVVSNCLADLTRTRTAELKQLAAGIGN